MNPYLESNAPLRLQEDERGDMRVVVDMPAESYRGSFFCQLASARSVRLNVGTVNSRVPVINGISLDGINAFGARSTRPELMLEGGPDKELRSWVCLQTAVDLKTGKLDPKNRDAVTIVHLNDLAKKLSNGLSIDDGKGVGVKPICLVLWESAAVVARLHQIVWFDQSHSFKPVGIGGIHIFSIAA